MDVPRQQYRRRDRLGRHLAALTVAASLATVSACGSGESGGFDSLTPYIDVTGGAQNLARAAEDSGVRYFTLGFVTDGGGCRPTWGGTIPLNDKGVADAVKGLREMDGNVRISFGGQTGTELALACASPESLVAVYQQAIDEFGATHADFDIEGTALNDAASINRRNQAIRILQDTTRAKGRALHVSYTLPVMPTGLGQEEMNLLRNAKDAGVDIGSVNIMAMSYAPDLTGDMGDYAISAAEATQGDLATLWPEKSDAELWRMVAVTPMLGINDITVEKFQLDDARQLVDFAKQKKLAWLGYWSVMRDKACIRPMDKPVESCSGIAQQPYEFSEIFKSYDK